MGESWPRSWVQTERSEVCTHDRGQDSPIQTDLARLISCLLYGKEGNFNSFNVTGLLTFCLRTAMSLTETCRNFLVFFTFLFVIRLFGTSINDWDENKRKWWTFLYFSLLPFQRKIKPVDRCRSRWENLDRGQYRFQPIKFVNSVVPSPSETQPHNKVKYCVCFAKRYSTIA